MAGSTCCERGWAAGFRDILTQMQNQVNWSMKWKIKIEAGIAYRGAEA